MKNLFKNLMLVAVAAMGFTACEQVNDDVNATKETFKVNIVGEFADDTRSGFVGSETDGDKTLYRSAWDGSETVRFAIIPDTFVDGDKATYVDVENESEGDCATFAPTFDSNVGTIHAFSPKGVYDSNDASACKGGFTSNAITLKYENAYVVVPAEQTPLANSVDPAAHILAGKADFAEDVIMPFNHVVAYGKMTIKNFAGDIDKVEVTASESLAGISCKYYYNEGKLNNANVKTITLNADNVEGNVFWFGCAPADLTNGTLTVKVYSGDDTYTKELAISGKNFKFQQGHVASFGVNMQGVEADAKAPVPSTTIEDGNYVIAGYVDGKYYALPNANKTSSGTIAHSEVTVTEGKVSAAAAAGYVWTVAAAEGGYTFFNGEHYLTAAETSGAKLKTQTDAVAWALGESGDYGYKFISPKASNRYLSCRINDSYNVFGAYINYGDGEYFGVHLLPIDGKVKTALVAPVVTATAEGTTIIVAWEAVDGAKDYTITINGGASETITATSKEFTGLEYDTNYTFTVVANPTDTEAYTSSPVATAEARTGVDPNATETIDVINLGFIGIESYPSYTSWSDRTGISGAVYAGQSHKNGDAIQMRTSNSNSGIVTTKSGGKIKKVVVEWSSKNGNDGHKLQVYGKNTAYTAATDLYATGTDGDVLGAIVRGTSTELVIEGDYTYIGLRSYSGAIYIQSISIYWEPSNGETPVLTKLGTPTGLTPYNITDSSFTLSWNAVANATEYKVSCGSETKNVTTTSCEFTGLVADTEYNVSVIALGDGVNYADSDAVADVVTTAKAEEPEQPSDGGAKTYTFTITKADFNTTSYVANNNEKTSIATASDGTTLEVKWTSYQVMQQNSTMQWQKSKGYIFNSTDLGTIDNVTIDKADGTFTTYKGSSQQPTSNGTGGYFQIKVGGATGKVNSIKVTFTK